MRKFNEIFLQKKPFYFNTKYSFVIINIKTDEITIHHGMYFNHYVNVFLIKILHYQH